MNEIAIIFWTLVFAAGLAAMLVRDLRDDDPTRSPGYQPPRSHDDEFEHSGAYFH